MERSYVIVYKGNIIGAFNQNNITNYVILNDKIAVIYVPENFNEKILMDIKEVSYWDIEIPMSTTIEILENDQGQTVQDAINLDYIKNNPYVNLTGKGVIIATIGSGIDYMHPDFMFSDGKTKIISIWDQEKEINPPPEGMIFGSEFTREEINEAIENKNLDLTNDEIGIGTISAGLAAGTGRLNVNNRGVAIDSELVVVKLRSVNGLYKEGRISYRNTDFLCAIRYVLDVAIRENKMLIINLELAERSRVYILTTYLDTFDEIRTENIVIVSAAGNEGNTDIHHQSEFKSGQITNDVTIQVGEQNSLKITLSTSGPDKIAAAIISPSGEISNVAYYSPDYYLYTGKFNLENSYYEMRFIYPWIATGQEELVIIIYNIKPGVWTIRLIPEDLVIGFYDLYLPNKNLIDEKTRFLDPSPDATITMYGTTNTTITVGAFNGTTDSLWIGSSRGPVRAPTKRVQMKPNIIAPGVNIVSPFINQSYISSTGTGVSSSIVCGVLALFMEYLSKEGGLTRKSISTQVLKTYLMLGARRQSIYTYPNALQGYGILDLKKTINIIASNI